jgi:hypothetical protein
LVGLKILDVREHVRKDGNVETVGNVGKDENVENERNVENVNGLTSYVSSSWNLCRRISNQNLFLQGDVVFSQDLERQAPVNKLKSYIIIIIIVKSFIFHFIKLQKKLIMVILILDK